MGVSQVKHKGQPTCAVHGLLARENIKNVRTCKGADILYVCIQFRATPPPKGGKEGGEGE